jgi:hypothetical protein
VAALVERSAGDLVSIGTDCRANHVCYTGVFALLGTHANEVNSRRVLRILSVEECDICASGNTVLVVLVATM